MDSIGVDIGNLFDFKIVMVVNSMVSKVTSNPVFNKVLGEVKYVVVDQVEGPVGDLIKNTVVIN